MDLHTIVEQWRTTGVPVKAGVRAAVAVARDASPALFPDEESIAEVFAGHIAKHTAIPLHDNARHAAMLELGRRLAALLFRTLHGDRAAFVRVLENNLSEILAMHEHAWQRERAGHH